MALRTWLKKNEIFDSDINDILEKEYKIKDPYNDFANISSKRWKKFAKQIKFQKKKELKDNKTYFRFEKKIAKLSKEWKKQQGKKKKNAVTIVPANNDNDNDDNVSNQSNLSPKKSKNKKKKNKKNKNKKNPKKNKQLSLTNPYSIKLILSYWMRNNQIKINKKTSKKFNLLLSICKFCPIFGYGNESSMIINANKEQTLRSDEVYKFSNITLKKKAILSVDTFKTKAPLQEYNNLDGYGGRLILKVSGNITMHQGSKITVRARGYPGGHGKGVKGGKGMGINDKGGADGEWTSAAGGHYNDLGDIKDGTEYKQIDLGSGGGGITGSGNRFFPGGIGGGVLIIECNKLIMKSGGCVISASGETSAHGGGGSGGVIWIKCLSFSTINKNKNNKACKIVCKGGKGDGDEYSEGKEQGGDGKIRIDILNDNDKSKIKKIVKCNNVFYGNC